MNRAPIDANKHSRRVIGRVWTRPECTLHPVPASAATTEFRAVTINFEFGPWRLIRYFSQLRSPTLFLSPRDRSRAKMSFPRILQRPRSEIQGEASRQDARALLRCGINAKRSPRVTPCIRRAGTYTGVSLLYERTLSANAPTIQLPFVRK